MGVAAGSQTTEEIESSTTALLDCAAALLVPDLSVAEISTLVYEAACQLFDRRIVFVGACDKAKGMFVVPTAIRATWTGPWPSPGTIESPLSYPTTTPVPPLQTIAAIAYGKLMGVLALTAGDRLAKACDLSTLRRLADLYALALWRCQADAQLALLASVVEQTAASVVITDSAGAICYTNPTFSRVTGYGREHVIGHNPRLLKSGYTLQIEYERLWATISAGYNWHGEFHNRRKNGDYYWETAAISPIRDSYGNITHYAAIKEEITTRKEAEIETLHAKELAESANRAKSTFLAHVSHELRTPLNAILGFAEMMEQELYGPLGDSHYNSYVKYITDSGRHLLALINDLLDLSKIEAGRMDPADEEVDLGAVMESTCALLRGRAEAGRVLLSIDRINAHPDSFSIFLRADSRMVRQILLNIVSNAIKFTPPEGRVILTAHVDVDGSVIIRVRDTGEGMDEGELVLALTPFCQLNNPFLRNDQGSGLGLPLAKSLAELHGGSLTISSTPHVGTVVAIRFPPERRLI